ncbi:MAG: adenosine deaminase [Stecheria intestinalis]|nr:adenosine deaminase [Stecheria intestinalis]
MKTEFDFPKVELHCHLDGSFRPETLFELAEQNHVELPWSDPVSYMKWVRIHANSGSVNEYLKMFDDPIRVMQKPEALERLTFELIEDLREDHVCYAEIRFAPQLHTAEGMTQRDAIEAVLCGRKKALEKYSDISIGILACMMCVGPETANWDKNMETVKIAPDYLGKGLVGIDLAGAEGFVPLNNFAPLFEEASRLGVPFTCHAGDSQGPDTVRDAMDFGAVRIGHGHHVYNSPALARKAIEKGITIEVCPTSNIQCLTQPSYEQHPAKNLLMMGLPVTINTDNRTLAGVTLESEYQHCLKEMGFTEKDLVLMNLNAINAAFCSEAEKEPVRKALEQALTQY